MSAVARAAYSYRNDPAVTITVSDPSLEDVFIELMSSPGGKTQ